MNIITKLNDLITKNFNNYLKNYFNNMNYVDKQGSFSNYYNFINDLDSFNDSFIKDIIKSYFKYIDDISLIRHIDIISAILMGFMKERILLLYLVKLILKEDIIMTKSLTNISSLLIYF